MPRTFTLHELRTFTHRQIASLSCEDTDAFHQQWLDMACKATAESEAEWVAGDRDQVDGCQRYEIGE